ncbi:MAG TPA: hypothetical protein VFT13_03495 [Candidatus Krumholzibacteria bacterium]|nr:hypothetical protein [Candidatus Krumholzibacteria bacterium]
MSQGYLKTAENTSTPPSCPVAAEIHRAPEEIHRRHADPERESVQLGVLDLRIGDDPRHFAHLVGEREGAVPRNGRDGLRAEDPEILEADQVRAGGRGAKHVAGLDADLASDDVLPGDALAGDGDIRHQESLVRGERGGVEVRPGGRDEHGHDEDGRKGDSEPRGCA